MKTIRSIAILLVISLLCSMSLTGCNLVYEQESSWIYDSDGNISDITDKDVTSDDNNAEDDTTTKSNVSLTESKTAKEKGYLDDYLDDWSKVFGRGADLMFDGYKPAFFEGDYSRVRRTDTDGGDSWISWKFEGGISEFAVAAYWDTNVRVIKVSVSKDNKTWTELKNPKNSDISIGSDWTKRVSKYYGIDKSNIYVKIDFGKTPSGDHTHSPNVSRIRINNIDKMDDPNRFFEGRNAATFYIDSKNGSDNNSGTSKDKPLKSLNVISKRYFQPGDKILFKSGCTFNGSLNLNGMGSSAKPITIGIYGGKAKAKIAARGGNAISLKMQYVTLENLEITNSTGLVGIYCVPPTTGKINDIYIKNCYIHDINAKQTNFAPGTYDTGGIYVAVDGLDPTWINNLHIENNVIEKVSRCGIFINSEWAFRPGTWGREGHYKSDTSGWYPYTNLIIRGNTITEAAGDSIVVSGSKGALVEKNTVTKGFTTKKITKIACAQVWCVNTNDSVFQYNDVSYSNLPAGCGDGESFDIDIASVRAVFQYNYSHDNEGGFMLICNNKDASKLSRDNVARFNLSVNDGSASKARAPFMIDRKNENTHIYNNTIYMKDADMVVMQYSDEDMPTTDNFKFTNNIFYGATGKTMKWVAQTGWRNTVFDNNIFYNASVDGLKKLSGITVKNEKTDNPKFANESINLQSAKRADAIKAFTPTNKLRGATNISDNGGKDISGNKITNIDFYGCVKY